MTNTRTKPKPEPEAALVAEPEEQFRVDLSGDNKIFSDLPISEKACLVITGPIAGWNASGIIAVAVALAKPSC